MWLFNRDEAQGVLTMDGATERAGLADFDDAGHFYNCGVFAACLSRMMYVSEFSFGEIYHVKHLVHKRTISIAQ